MDHYLNICVCILGCMMSSLCRHQFYLISLLSLYRMRHLRSEDRKANSHRYPELHYPEVYLLHSGYKTFFGEHKVGWLHINLFHIHMDNLNSPLWHILCILYGDGTWLNSLKVDFNVSCLFLCRICVNPRPTFPCCTLTTLTIWRSFGHDPSQGPQAIKRWEEVGKGWVLEACLLPLSVSSVYQSLI